MRHSDHKMLVATLATSNLFVKPSFCKISPPTKVVRLSTSKYAIVAVGAHESRLI